MLVVETIARIRRDHLVRGVPIKKIARDLRVPLVHDDPVTPDVALEALTE